MYTPDKAATGTHVNFNAYIKVTFLKIFSVMDVHACQSSERASNKFQYTGSLHVDLCFNP